MDGLTGDPGRSGHLGDVQIAIVDVLENLVLQFRLGLSRRRLELARLVRLLLELFKQPGRAFLRLIAFLSTAW